MNRALAFQVLMLLALNTEAKDNSHKNIGSLEWTIFPLKDGRLRVNINNNLKMKLIVMVKSFEGKTIQQNYIGKRPVKTAINYDISELKDGDYEICIYSKRMMENKHFHIENISVQQHRLLSVR
ncbi:hypothetical protein FEN17_02240 [Dyadobacter luticola]|uniref:T9SS type A sorting domain-containing protein n=2 Tax=Dyadobacter luticola TaxID=1979387 RepID=A0A5R9L2I9_9BACT|nr:hypothetical protein FEN17_02240 [Dyadobacter luticola]